VQAVTADSATSTLGVECKGADSWTSDRLTLQLLYGSKAPVTPCNMVHHRQAHNCKHTFKTAAEQDAYPDPNPVSVSPQRDDGVPLDLRAGVGHLGFLIKVALMVELGQAMVRQGAHLAGELQSTATWLYTRHTTLMTLHSSHDTAQPHGSRPGTQLS